MCRCDVGGVEAGGLVGGVKGEGADVGTKPLIRKSS